MNILIFSHAKNLPHNWQDRMVVIWENRCPPGWPDIWDESYDVGESLGHALKRILGESPDINFEIHGDRCVYRFYQYGFATFEDVDVSQIFVIPDFLLPYQPDHNPAVRSPAGERQKSNRGV